MGNNVIDIKFNEQKECLPLIFKNVGPKGGDGKSAYEQALEGGYTGTEEEFTNDLGKVHVVSDGLQEVEEAKEITIEKAASAEASAQAAANSALDASFQNKISNCITKIPQDINLQLSADGTLTLKAGSKVYRGNGAAVNITQDISMTYPSSGTILVCATISATQLAGRVLTNCASGTSDPQSANSIYFDTAAKVVRFYPSSGVSSEVSLPIAICTANGKISSIDQVFNGFGYIGNTIFALPGVECLIPNGRNTDGTLKNTQISVAAVRTLSFSNQTQSDFGLTATTIFSSANAVYNEDDNKNFNILTGNYLGFCNCGTVETDTTGFITSLTPKTVLHAVDYNDTEWTSLQGKPSEKSTDLTLSSSGAQYTAPANGWFYLEKIASSGEYIEIKDGVGGVSQYAAADGQGLKLLYPAKVGKVVTISYTASGTTGAFRFIYDEGAK